ncbi:hypothetical protein WA026_023553 [Henosepilachna vigintioctopunctata]|uniref:TIR domain-containing protein n=1 Tax=Henosepilachna vigintioctopunctata TaxID=420089 RepID=A0AAW1USC0_9CUCU
MMTTCSLRDVKTQDAQCELWKARGGYTYTCLIGPNQTIEILIYSLGNIRMECKGVTTLKLSHLPEINFNRDIGEMHLINCPLIESGFRAILDRFQAKRVTTLSYKTNFSFGPLEFKHFLGLDSVHYLVLTNNIDYFDGNIFKLIPNLIQLTLNKNRLILYDELFIHCQNLIILNLNNNQIDYLPSNIFKGMFKLSYLYLERNNIKSIEYGVFSDLINLVDLRMSKNLIFEIGDKAFESQENLATIDLSGNKLGYISAKMFRNCTLLKLIFFGQNTKLELENRAFSDMLYLSSILLNNNNIKTLPDILFRDSRNLLRMNLQHNKLKTIPNNIFDNFQHLESLYLDNNILETLDRYIFKSLFNLKILTLNANRLRSIDGVLFENLNNIQSLDLSFNQILAIPSTFFAKKVNLIDFSINNNQLDLVGFSPDHMKNCRNIRKLNFANNSISQFPYEIMEVLMTRQTKLKDVRVFLQNNNISEIWYKGPETSITNFPILVYVDISENPIICNCLALNLVPKINTMKDPTTDSKSYVILHYDKLFCAGPPLLANVPINEVDVNELVCPLGKKCSMEKKCDCLYKSATKTVLIICSKSNLTEIPQLLVHELPQNFHFVKWTTVEVHLEDNFLEEAPTEIDGYHNVTELHLQRNGIKSIEWIPPELKVFNLENNKLEQLDDQILNSLNESRIEKLSLANNPWKCDCTSKDFLSYLWTHISMISNATYIRCKKFEKPLVLLDDEEFCPIRSVFTSVLSSVILICFIIAAAIILLYYIYQKEILIWLYARGSCLWLIKEERLDKNKKYDAFVSFAHQDEIFVMDRLVPILELGIPPFKLCVHVRDWIPGEYIATQISNSVRDSRRTLIILSPNFIKSVWGRMEFRAAHTSAMKEGRVRIILIIYGEVNMDQLDEELKAYIKTNTYIEWGDPWFWEKLRYALPKTRNMRKKPSQQEEREGIELQ